MSRRIADTFARLRETATPGLVAYVTAGDPDLPSTASILVALCEAGASVLEVGVPFSDPLADGPAIQRASERALAGGTTLRRTLELIASVRERLTAPVVLFTYANPIVRLGEAAFVESAARAGVDGVLMLDLPVEEAGPFRERLVDAGIDPIFMLSPTTTDERLEQAAALGRGFLYVISRLGVTGARADIAADLESLVRRVRAHTSLPIAVGFGISHPDHVAQVTRWADAAVVGSGLVEAVGGRADAAAARAGAYIRWLRGQP